jgi:hypothetical protein
MGYVTALYMFVWNQRRSAGFVLNYELSLIQWDILLDCHAISLQRQVKQLKMTKKIKYL